MFITRTSLPRRSFLRGLGAAFALPLLDAMTPAFAATRKAIPRLGFMYIPNGVNLAQWTPVGSGTGFAFSPTLRALEPYRDRVTVLSGLAHHAADRLNDGAGDHSRAAGAFLSGCHAKRTEGADLYLGITADQIAARTLGKDNLLASLELKLDDSDIAPLCDEGYTCAYMNTISWSSPATPLPMENNPRFVFQRLFGEGESASERVTQTREDRSILDTVAASMKRLESTLGPADRRRMEQYFESIREVEVRLERIEAQNAKAPAQGHNSTRPLGIPENFEDHINLMFDLQALAFQADITRVTTLMIGREEGGRSYPQAGVPDGHHSISHHDNNPEKLAKLAKIDAYHVQQLANFLSKLKQTPDGDGNLLDNSMILYGGGISNGNMHNHERLPIVLAGGGAGTLKGGQHIDYKQDVPMSNLLRSLLDKSGVHVETLGDATGTLSEI
jgi:hypothetical protein